MEANSDIQCRPFVNLRARDESVDGLELFLLAHKTQCMPPFFAVSWIGPRFCAPGREGGFNGIILSSFHAYDVDLD